MNEVNSIVIKYIGMKNNNNDIKKCLLKTLKSVDQIHRTYFKASNKKSNWEILNKFDNN